MLNIWKASNDLGTIFSNVCYKVC
uniref:Uncharacterized protein n=1 Tax=Rhizophora mucronata TaxID=61149 RepID=A0A2P2P298_RHIMU